MNRRFEGNFESMQTGRRINNRSDHAVSEAIGFIIIFGIILAGIGLVTMYGYPMLLQQQSSSDEQIMEKNLIVLQNDLKSLAYKTVPYKETSLRVGGGALTVYNTSYDNSTSSFFSIHDDAGQILNDDGSSPLTFHSGDLRYESTSAQTGMSLENGAVVKRMLANEGATMLSEPRWFYDTQTNTAVIYLIGFNTTDTMSLAGIGTVKMELGQTNYSEYAIPAGDTVYMKYTPNLAANYSTAWVNYFDTLKMTPPGSPGGDYILPLDTTKPARLVINRYEIIIKSL